MDPTPSRRGPRGPYAKSRHTRTAILDSALTVFAGSGYRSGSLRHVAEQVGISEAGLLHHFGSKKALLRAVLERRDDQTLQQFDMEPDGGIRVLRSTLELVEHSASTPGVVQLFCTLAAEATSHDHPEHAYFVERYVLVTDFFRVALEHMRARGELRPDVDPAVAARGVVAFMDGLQVQWLLDRESVDMAADLRAYFRSLVAVDL